jgi:hypothetical protein
VKLAAFDLETAKLIPENATNLKQYMPLGITCAALAFSDRENVVIWQGVPQLGEATCREIVASLKKAIEDGYTLLTWNGCSFDFAVLAQESGLTEECGRLALEHVDLMLLVTFTKGHFLGLEKALNGAGLSGKAKTLRLSDGTLITNMSGALAPRLWAKGEYQAVLDYLRADVVQLLELARVIDLIGSIEWTSGSGRLQSVPVSAFYPVKKCFEFPEPDVSWMDDPPSRDEFVDWIPNWRQRLVESLQSTGSAPSDGTRVQLEIRPDGSIAFEDSRGAPLSEELIREVKRQKKAFLLLWLQQECDEENQRIETLLRLHTATPRPDTMITFTSLEFDVSPPIAPRKSAPMPYPEPPSMREHSFLTKKIGLFGKSADKQNERMQSDHDDRVREWETAKAESEREYQMRLDEYAAQIAEYERQRAVYQQQQVRRRKLIEEERLTDTAAMAEFLAEVLQAIVWPAKTTVTFDIRDRGGTVVLVVEVPEFEDIPKSTASVNRRDLKLTYKERSRAQRHQDYVTHIHAIGFRVVGEAFVSLPTASTVVLSAFSQRLNGATGQASRECLYSVRVPRSKWSQIDFSNLNAIDVLKSFEEFELRRQVTKTGSISPVEPFDS